MSVEALQPTQVPGKTDCPHEHAREAVDCLPTSIISEDVIGSDGRLPESGCTDCTARHRGAGRAWHTKGCWCSPHRRGAQRPSVMTALRGTMLVAAVRCMWAGTPKLLGAHTAAAIPSIWGHMAKHRAALPCLQCSCGYIATAYGHSQTPAVAASIMASGFCPPVHDTVPGNSWCSSALLQPSLPCSALPGVRLAFGLADP